MKKFKYFWFTATGMTSLLYKVALGLGALCLIVSILAANTALNGNFFEIPVFDMFMDDDEYEDFTDDYDDLLDELDDASKEEKREIEDKTGMDFEDFQEYIEDLSLKKMTKLVETLKDVDGFETDAEGLLIFNILITVITVYAAIICFFTILSVYNGSGAGAITIYIISLPFHILLTGTGYLVVLSILYIGYAAVQIHINKEYRRYKKANRG